MVQLLKVTFNPRQCHSSSVCVRMAVVWFVARCGSHCRSHTHIHTQHQLMVTLLSSVKRARCPVEISDWIFLITGFGSNTALLTQLCSGWRLAPGFPHKYWYPWSLPRRGALWSPLTYIGASMWCHNICIVGHRCCFQELTFIILGLYCLHHTPTVYIPV